MSECNLRQPAQLDILHERVPTLSLQQPLTLDEVRDAQTYPVLMHRLMECCPPENDFDLIVMALHTLMIEFGFQMVDRRRRRVLLTRILSLRTRTRQVTTI